MTMRAIAITKPGGPDVLALVERETPQPSRGEVRVRVRATAINRADLLQRMGAYPAPADAPPDIPGLELAGEVEALGPGVERLAVGDRVFGLVGGGAYAEQLVTHERALAKIPEGMSFQDAAAVPEAFITAHDAIVGQAGLTAGETLLIHAVGSGVGTAAVQLGRALGVFTIGTARTPDKLERAAVTVRGSDILTLPELLGLRMPDPLTLIIEAATPTPHIVMTTPSRVLRAVPREAVSRRPRRWAEPGTIVTSGPMHLVAMKERDYVELVRSPTYWNQADVKLDRLTAYSLNDQAAAANLYYTGRCDAVAANNVPSSYLPLLAGETRGGKPFADFSIKPYLGSYFMVVNTKKFDNVHLRRALSFAIDRSQLPAILHGGEIGVASYTPGAPIASLTADERALCGVTADDPGVALIIEAGKLCYVPPRGLAYDADQARAELALAKAELGARFPRAVVYKFNSGTESHLLIAEYLQAQWKSVLGLDVEIESQEWQVFLSATRIGEYQIARMGWIGSTGNPESDFVSLWRCASANNRPKWCNQDFERLMDEAAVTVDPAARLAKIKAAEALVLEEAAIIPLYAYTQKNLRRPYVRGLTQNFIAQPPLWRIWLDPDWKNSR